MLESLLDEIPQLGESRRNSLLENFGSVSALKKVSAGELAKVPGIGEKLAEIIHSHLNKLESTSIDTETGEITSS